MMWLWIVLVIFTGVVSAFVADVLAVRRLHRLKPTCYFDGYRILTGDKLVGGNKCSGPPDLVYYSLARTGPVRKLDGVKVCTAHLNALDELATDLRKGF